MLSEFKARNVTKHVSLWAWVLILALPSALVSAQSASKSESNSNWKETSGTPYRGGIVTPPLPKAKFTLTDTSSAPFDFWQRTKGHVTLLFFGYTRCPD